MAAHYFYGTKDLFHGVGFYKPPGFAKKPPRLGENVAAFCIKKVSNAQMQEVQEVQVV